MNILTIVFEFAMYPLELEMKIKKKIISTYLPYFFFHNISKNTTLFLYVLIFASPVQIPPWDVGDGPSDETV